MTPPAELTAWQYKGLARADFNIDFDAADIQKDGYGSPVILVVPPRRDWFD